MFSSLDILYIVLALCAIVVTCVLVMLSMRISRVLEDAERVASNVEHITTMVERIAQIVFPGVERVAHGADMVEKVIETGIAKKIKKLIDKL